MEIYKILKTKEHEFEPCKYKEYLKGTSSIGTLGTSHTNSITINMHMHTTELHYSIFFRPPRDQLHSIYAIKVIENNAFNAKWKYLAQEKYSMAKKNPRISIPLGSPTHKHSVWTTLYCNTTISINSHPLHQDHSLPTKNLRPHHYNIIKFNFSIFNVFHVACCLKRARTFTHQRVNH